MDNISSKFLFSTIIPQFLQTSVIINLKLIVVFSSQVNIFCNETFEMCKYRDEDIRCCDHFQPVYSEHGFCFSFNGRYFDDADSE